MVEATNHYKICNNKTIDHAHRWESALAKESLALICALKNRHREAFAYLLHVLPDGSHLDLRGVIRIAITERLEWYLEELLFRLRDDTIGHQMVNAATVNDLEIVENLCSECDLKFVQDTINEAAKWDCIEVIRYIHKTGFRVCYTEALEIAIRESRNEIALMLDGQVDHSDGTTMSFGETFVRMCEAGDIRIERIRG